MLCYEATACTVITGDQIELAAFRERRRIAVKQHHWNACVAEMLGEVLVNLLASYGSFQRCKKDATNAAFDELFT